MTDISNYQKIREDSQSFYSNIGRICCPALNNEYVNFTSEGFNHLIYKSERTERDRSVQIMKFKLLTHAKTIIKISTTYQEYDESIIEVRKKKKKKVVHESSIVRYWGFVSIIRNFRVKVIIRQIGNGQKHFWSVIPTWSKAHYRDTKFITTAFGDLKED